MPPPPLPLLRRRAALRRLENLRGRTLLCVVNVDRGGEPTLPGLSTDFAPDLKERIYRVLERTPIEGGLDLLLYTRGGDANAVWPVVTLLREFDPDFEVLIPYRCYSAGTLLALGARRLLVGPLGELSPIDPSTTHPFNPQDPLVPELRTPISTEDLQAYRRFVLDLLDLDPARDAEATRELLPGFLERVTQELHPLALGNAWRAWRQVQQLAQGLLALHPLEGRQVDTVVDALTHHFLSHQHMLSRSELQALLGEDRVTLARGDLARALDGVLRAYEDALHLGRDFFLGAELDETQGGTFHFAGAVVESARACQVFWTAVRARSAPDVPENVQIQLAPGQRLPRFPGVPRRFDVEVHEQGWWSNPPPRAPAGRRRPGPVAEAASTAGLPKT